MLTVYSEKHRLRDAATELCGGQVVPPFECPVRAEHVVERVRQVGLGEGMRPTDFGLEPVLRVHDGGYANQYHRPDIARRYVGRLHQE